MIHSARSLPLPFGKWIIIRFVIYQQITIFNTQFQYFPLHTTICRRTWRVEGGIVIVRLHKYLANKFCILRLSIPEKCFFSTTWNIHFKLDKVKLFSSSHPAPPRLNGWKCVWIVFLHKFLRFVLAFVRCGESSRPNKGCRKVSLHLLIALRHKTKLQSRALARSSSRDGGLCVSATQAHIQSPNRVGVLWFNKLSGIDKPAVIDQVGWNRHKK